MLKDNCVRQCRERRWGSPEHSGMERELSKCQLRAPFTQHVFQLHTHAHKRLGEVQSRNNEPTRIYRDKSIDNAMLMAQKRVPNTQNESKQTTQQEIDCHPIKDSFLSLLIQPMLNTLLGVLCAPRGMQRSQDQQSSETLRFKHDKQ